MSSLQFLTTHILPLILRPAPAWEGSQYGPPEGLPYPIGLKFIGVIIFFSIFIITIIASHSYKTAKKGPSENNLTKTIRQIRYSSLSRLFFLTSN